MNYFFAVAVGIFIAFDIITGLLKAIKHGNVKSAIMKEGLLSKFSEVIILVLMYVIEYLFPLININLNLPLVQCVAVYIIIMELSSIIENIGKINPELANKLSSIFADFTHEKED